jgi:hypothetical protein
MFYAFGRTRGVIWLRLGDNARERAFNALKAAITRAPLNAPTSRR